MIPARGEVGPALRGAMRLIRGDAGGLELLDVSPAGAVRSFFAMLLVSPLWLALIALEGRLSLATFPVELLRFVILWLSFPVALTFILPFLGLRDRFPHVLAAGNWATVLVFPVVALPAFLSAASAEPGAGAQLVALVALAWSVWAQVQVLRTSLGSTAQTAIPLAILGFLLSDLVLILMGS